MTAEEKKGWSRETVDPEHPWLGLSSYTEETRAYFHGRDAEAAELARRVQRKLLTVLFGQSGLGKTSLLRAGLVPRLRGEGYAPVYVRVDYSPDSPPPSEQIKQAIFRATAAAGHWTQAGAAIEGESLWEFLHHRGDLLRDAEGRTLLPLLIFDQFEEIFTLAQADDAGRQRARQFLEDLADLVENRPPTALEKRLEQDEADAEHFDFARADYRVLIALREDYLAHLESTKTAMPSVTQNRMRLARMTGEQALAAVVEPGGKLVTEEVAEQIVRFVAGGSELASAEVEPSLLSLVCRELNNVRIAQGRPEISADLLAGSRETILSEFYERALADQPAGVRQVIEDELLTESGYRESLAEERVQKALATAGAAPDALAKLVDRRLLRIEERLDVRRVELTHDVLCGVVRSSRDLRHEREARDEAERRLAEQREREAETHRQLVRTRMIAAVSAGLMLVAIAGAAFGWINYRRAHQADLAAQQARSDAEQLVGFLMEDFYAELEPTGRVETMGKLAQKAVEYYEQLPPELLTSRTRVYQGMALIRWGGALLAGDRLDEANRALARARALFEELRAADGSSEPVAYGLALALFTPYSAWGVIGGPESKPTDLPQAADLLRPFVGKSRESSILYADVLNHLSHQQPKEQAVAMCDEARAVLEKLGATRLEDLTAASIYADTADSEARHLWQLGRLEEAERLEREVYEIAERVLVQRPGDIRSMENRVLAAGLLGDLAFRRHDYATAASQAERAKQAGEDLVHFNPSDISAWLYLVRGYSGIADLLFQEGKVRRSLEVSRATVALADDDRRPASLGPMLEDTWYDMARLEADSGNRAAAERAYAEGSRASAEWASQLAPDNPQRMLTLTRVPLERASVQLVFGEYQAALDGAAATAQLLGNTAFSKEAGTARRIRDAQMQWAYDIVTSAALRLGRYEEAEAAARRRLELPFSPFDDPEEGQARRQVQLAHAIAKQGRGAEALVVVEPALEYCRREKLAGASGADFRGGCAEALYVSAISQGTDAAGRSARKQALDEASELLSGASAELRQLASARELAGWIAEARG
jgi:Novel STAND NTPase 1